MTLIEFTKHYISFHFDSSHRKSEVNGLYDFEYDILKALGEDKNTLFIKSRMMYLSTMYSAYMLWFLLYNDSYHTEIFYISPTYRHVYGKMSNFLKMFLSTRNSYFNENEIFINKESIRLGNKQITFKKVLNDSVGMLPNRDRCKVVILDDYPEDREFISLITLFRMMGVKMSIGKSLSFDETETEKIYYEATDFICYKFPYYLNPNWEMEKTQYLTNNKIMFLTSMECEFINHKNEFNYLQRDIELLTYESRGVFKKAKTELIKLIGYENIHSDEL
tara:strand:- start:8756 stop:9586 length:831 start_codon:yes stop_codon:yes gene_type:complete